MAFVWVGLGGFIGAVCRFALNGIPNLGEFPLATFLINFLGAVAIGAIVEAVDREGVLSENAALFLKTGVCGGFTTFSTFSLETLELLEGGQIALGVGYACVSVVACVAGVLLGKTLARAVLAS